MMPKGSMDEVEVLRFFETEPLDKAAVLFNIVSDKMRGRLGTNSPHAPELGSALPGRRGRKRKFPLSAPELNEKIGEAT